jgi:hypothetical protein
MHRKIRRPSASLVLAVVAVVLALCGTVYAGTKISGTTIKVKSLPGNRLTLESLPGNRLKPGGVTGKQVDESTLGQVPSAKNADTATTARSADTANTAHSANTANTATTAGTATNADAVDGHSAGCPAGTMPFAGACWETAARAATTQPLAAQVCTAAGGTLPDALDLRAFALTSGVTLASTDEWSSSINVVSGADNYTGVTVSQTGVVNLSAQTDPKGFRCVLPLLR